jgi:hypothetical protein
MTMTKEEVFALLRDDPTQQKAKDWLKAKDKEIPGYPRALLEILQLKMEAQQMRNDGGDEATFDALCTVAAVMGVAATEAFDLTTEQVLADLQTLEEMAGVASRVLRDSGLTPENARAVHLQAQAEREQRGNESMH